MGTMVLDIRLAVEDCEKAIKLEPGFIKAYNHKGRALAAMKKHPEAVASFGKALEIDGNNQEALDGMKKCKDAMYAGMNEKERRDAAMGDPAIQATYFTLAFI